MEVYNYLIPGMCMYRSVPLHRKDVVGGVHPTSPGSPSSAPRPAFWLHTPLNPCSWSSFRVRYCPMDPGRLLHKTCCHSPGYHSSFLCPPFPTYSIEPPAFMKYMPGCLPCYPAFAPGHLGNNNNIRYVPIPWPGKFRVKCLGRTQNVTIFAIL